MKKIFYSILGLCMMMPVVSCQKETSQVVTNSERVTFEAVTEQPTKTSIQDTDKTAQDYGKVSWCVGDKVQFVYENNSQAEVGYPVSEALTEGDIVNGKATFAAELPADIKANVAAGTAHLYAVYPSTIVVDYHDGSTFKMTVPSEQDGTFANASIAVAKLNKADVEAPLEFKNFCGLFRVTVADESVRKLVVSSNTDIAGLVNVSFTGPKVIAAVDVVKEIKVNVEGAGTYYVAALPGALDGVNVYAYDSEDKLIGDASTSNTITLERAQMRSMGTIGTSSYYFVKVDGTGDGSSWDNAANLASMTTILASADTKKICMAAGEYTEAAEMKVSQTGASYKIYGSYPAEASGMDLTGRGAAETIINCNGLRGIVATKGDILVDGITFQNAARQDNSTPGSVLVIQGATSFKANNCKFINNTHTSTGTLLGVIRLASTAATFKNCVFSGNSSTSSSGSTKYGSVIYQYATATLTLDGCEFYNNNAVSFGTVLYTIGTTTITNCKIGDTEKGNTSTSRGGAICMDASSKLTIKDTQFKANSGAIGGAIYVNAIKDDASLTIANCSFKENTATNTSNGGGAIGISGDSKTYAGMLEIKNCDFDGNSTPSCGGAVWANGANVSFTDCNFTSNKATADAASENGLGGGAVYSASSAATKVFFNRCFFANNTVAAKQWGHHIDINSETALFGMNNCVVRAPWGVTLTDSSYKGIGSLITTKAFTAVVNTTIYSRTGNAQITLGSKTDGGSAYINDIIINAAGTPNNFSNPDVARYNNISYTLYNQVRSGSNNNYTFTGCKSGVTYEALGWTKDGNGTSVSTNDVRDHIYVYPWSGTVDGFTNATLAQVRTALEGVCNVGPAFSAWLGSDLSKDILGVDRDANAMWPGSYQSDNTKAGLENFIVK